MEVRERLEKYWRNGKRRSCEVRWLWKGRERKQEKGQRRKVEKNLEVRESRFYILKKE